MTSDNRSVIYAARAINSQRLISIFVGSYMLGAFVTAVIAMFAGSLPSYGWLIITISGVLGGLFAYHVVNLSRAVEERSE